MSGRESGMNTVDGLYQVVTATGKREDALELASRAVGSGLAACVQVSGPVSSVYRWKGEVRREVEWLCTMKTPEGTCGALVELVRENHGYETPEILVQRVDGTSREYLDWAVSVTEGA